MTTIKVSLNIDAILYAWKQRGGKGTQRALAEELGLTEMAVSHYKKGTSNPQLETIVKIQKLTGLTLKEMVK